MRNYLVAMGIRTACLPLAVWAFSTERYALAWVAAVGAAFIPSFAVMLANAVDRRQLPSDATVASPVQGLGPGRPAADDPGPEPASPDEGSSGAGTDAPLQGTVVSSRDTAYPTAPPDVEDGPDEERPS